MMKMISSLAFLLGMSLVEFGHGEIASAETNSFGYSPNWVQPRLFVSFWYDPVVPAEAIPARFAEIRNANFTAVLGGFGAKTTDMINAQIAAAESNGLGLVATASSGQNISTFKKSLALRGYQLKDEPAARDFQGLKALTESIKTSHPGKLRYINLLPFCPPSQLNATSYEDYVSSFVRIVKPDVLSFDYYPNFNAPRNSSDPSLDGYRRNLAVARKFALLASIPLWNFMAVESVFGGEPDPTESQLRWQVFTSLAYGARGFMYFTYWGAILVQREPFKSGESSSSPVLSVNEKYYQVKRINSAVLAWEPYLMDARSVGVFYCSHDDGKISVAEGVQPSEAPWLKSIASTVDFLIGQFRLSDGRAALMIQNQNAAFNGVAKITFSSLLEKNTMTEVSSHDGNEGFVLNEGSGEVLTLTIQSGGARLLLIK